MGRLVTLAEAAEQAFTANVPPSDWGPKAWALLHGTVAVLPCATCRSEGVVMMEGLHDMVNVYKGEAPERPKSLCELAGQAVKASVKARACPVSRKGGRTIMRVPQEFD